MARWKWRVAGYRVPTQPPRDRLVSWTGLRKLLAVNAPQSVRILPYSLGDRPDLKKISGDIGMWGGRPMLMASMILEEGKERCVVALFPAREEKA